MQGVIFTEFLEMVEQRYSLSVVDTILRKAAPPSGGAYTTVGTYPSSELAALVVALSAEVDCDVPSLLEAYGEYLVPGFAKSFPEFFAATKDALSFIAGVESYIHREVLRLYPDAELPSFEIVSRTSDELVLDYRSSRGLGHLAVGITRGVGGYFHDPLDVRLARLDEEGTTARITVRRAFA